MATATKRSAGLKTRDAILEAARQLFLRQGFHATGMREIAREAGISLSAVYNHFSSKEEIFQAILSERNIYRTIAEALSRARGETVAELTESGYAEIMAALQGKEEFLLLIFIDVLEFQGRYAAGAASASIPCILQFFQQLHQLGRRRGELRDLSPVLLGRAYLQVIFSSFVLENIVKVFGHQSMMRPLSVENWQQGLIDILLHGVLKPAPSPEGGEP